MDLETKEAKQVTSFREHVANFSFFNDKNRLLVTVDKNFAKGDPDFQYWLVDLEEDSQKHIQIQIPEDHEI